MNVVFGLIGTAAMLAWSTLMYAWVDERRRISRRRSIVAQAALRRRLDQELARLAARIEAVADFLSIEINDAEDDTPEPERDDDPATVPMALAWDDSAAQLVDEVQPSRSAEWVEEAIRRFDFSGRRR